MALDRWLALIILGICCVYGYTAWFLMDGSLAPFMRRNPVWPSTFPKILSIVCGLTALWVLVFQHAPPGKKTGEIDYRRLLEYKLQQAGGLIALMVSYALTLRPLGFLLSTALFLAVGAVVLGERKFHILVPVALLSSGLTWYLVAEVLGVYLRPLPILF